MSKDQLNALVNAEVVELTEAQLLIVNTKLGNQIVSTIFVLSRVDYSARDRTFNSCNNTNLNDWIENEKVKCN